MNVIQQLLTDHIDIWTGAETAKRSGRGRSSGNTNSVYGIKKLRELILELAVRGKLVPQDPNDEPASELLKRIQAEKAKLITEGKLKKEKPLATIGEEEKPFELPKGWEWVYFGEIAQHNSGKTLDKGRNKGVLRDYITTSNLYWGTFELHSMRQMPIEESELERCTALKGDLLVCEGGEAGRAAVWILDKEVCFQNHIHRARLYVKISPFYAYRYFEKLNASGEIEQYRKGVGISNMSGKALASVVFALPPLAEQHRIVAKVDELMALCDQLEQQHNNAQQAHQTLVKILLDTLTQSQNASEFQSHWQRIAEHFETLFTTQASIDTLKQTLLQLAVMGKLVPQDPNDEPARELLKRIQTEKAKLIAEGKLKKEKPLAPIGADEKPFELPMGWEWANLQTFVLSIMSGGTPSKTNSKYWNGDIPWASVKDLNVEKFLETTEDTITIAGLENGSKLANKGDLIICTRMGLGKIAIAAVDVAINQDLKALKLTELLNVDYFIKFYATLNIKGSGMTVAGIKQEELLGYAIPTPPLAEQHRIVAKVDALMALCDQLKTRIQQANQQQKIIANALVAQAVV